LTIQVGEGTVFDDLTIDNLTIQVGEGTVFDNLTIDNLTIHVGEEILNTDNTDFHGYKLSG